VVFCRNRFLAKVKSVSGYSIGSAVDIRRASELLNPEALTIGFARRFAPYKRATLLFTDPDRLLRIISDKRRPVQFIFAARHIRRTDWARDDQTCGAPGTLRRIPPQACLPGEL